MTIDEIVTLVQAVSENGLTSFEYEEGDQKLVLKKREKVSLAAMPVSAQQPEQSAVTAAGMIGGMAETGDGVEKKVVDIGADHVVSSPLVGTFYTSSSPESEPFVKVGDQVRKGQVLGIIEAMKLMNEIESEYDGVVEAVLVDNEGVVEYGQPLFRIR